MKKKNGITLIALVVTVIVLAILVSITTEIGINVAREATFYNAVEEMKVMQTKVNELYDEYKNGNNAVLEYGFSISENEEDEIHIKAIEAYDHVREYNQTEKNIGNFNDYRYYSVDYIKNTLDVEGIDLDFIVNIKSRTVILLDGVERERIIYYSLNELEGEQYNVEYREQN